MTSAINKIEQAYCELDAQVMYPDARDIFCLKYPPLSDKIIA